MSLLLVYFIPRPLLSLLLLHILLVYFIPCHWLSLLLLYILLVYFIPCHWLSLLLVVYSSGVFHSMSLIVIASVVYSSGVFHSMSLSVMGDIAPVVFFSGVFHSMSLIVVYFIPYHCLCVHAIAVILFDLLVLFVGFVVCFKIIISSEILIRYYTLNTAWFNKKQKTVSLSPLSLSLNCLLQSQEVCSQKVSSSVWCWISTLKSLTLLVHAGLFWCVHNPYVIILCACISREPWFIVSSRGLS